MLILDWLERGVIDQAIVSHLLRGAAAVQLFGELASFYQGDIVDVVPLPGEFSSMPELKAARPDDVFVSCLATTLMCVDSIRESCRVGNRIVLVGVIFDRDDIIYRSVDDIRWNGPKVFVVTDRRSLDDIRTWFSASDPETQVGKALVQYMNKNYPGEGWQVGEYDVGPGDGRILIYSDEMLALIPGLRARPESS